MLKRAHFETLYCGRSGITLQRYREHFITLPCACGEEGCEGWAAISYAGFLHHLIYKLPDKRILQQIDFEETVNALRNG